MGVVHDLLAHVDRGPVPLEEPARRSRSPAPRPRRTTAARRAGPSGRPPPRPTAVSAGPARRSARSARDHRSRSRDGAAAGPACRTRRGAPPPAAAGRGCQRRGLHVDEQRTRRPSRAPARPVASRAVVTTGPVRAASPARRSSPASNGADGHAIPGPSRHAHLGGDHDLPGPEVAVERAADTGHRQCPERILPEPPRLPPRAPGPVPADPDVAAGAEPRPDRTCLDPQGCAHEQRASGWVSAGRSPHRGPRASNRSYVWVSRRPQPRSRHGPSPALTPATSGPCRPEGRPRLGLAGRCEPGFRSRHVARGPGKPSAPADCASCVPAR